MRNTVPCRLVTFLLFLFMLLPLSASDIPSSWEYEEDGLDDLPELDFTREGTENPDRRSDEIANAFQSIEERFEKALHEDSDLKKARSIAEDAAKKYPDSRRTGQLFYRIIRKMVEREAAREKIIEHCKELTERFPRYAWSAKRILEKVTETDISINSQHPTSVKHGTSPTLRIHTQNLEKVTFRLYRVDPIQMVKSGIPLQSPSIPDGATPVKQWTHELQTDDSGFYEEVDLRVQKKGAYVVNISSEYYSVNTMAFVSNLALLTKNDGRMLLAYGARLSGQEAGSCQVVVTDNKRIVYEGKSNKDGVFAARLKGKTSNATVIFQKGDDVAISASRWGGSYEWSDVHVQTDRPVYRPGQKVHAKLILRRFDSRHKRMAYKEGEEVTVTLRDPKYNEVVQKTLKLNEYGTASFTHKLAEEPPLGDYVVRVRGDRVDGHQRFAVEEYKKPEFEVSVESKTTTGVIGEPVTFDISADYHFGEKVTDARVDYSVEVVPTFYRPSVDDRQGRYSWWDRDHQGHGLLSGGRSLRSGGAILVDREGFAGRDSERIAEGEGKLDDSGHLEVTIPTDKLRKGNSDLFKLILRARVTDKSRRGVTGTGSLKVGRSTRQISLSPERFSYKPDEQVSFRIHTADLGGTPVAGKVTCTVSVRTEDDYEHLLRKEVSTNDNGEGTLHFVPEQEGRYRVKAETSGPEGRITTVTEGVWVVSDRWRSPYSYNELSLNSEKSVYMKGDQLRIIATSSSPDAPVLFSVEVDHILEYEVRTSMGSVAMFERTVKQRYAPEVEVNANLFARNQHFSGRKTVRVPPVHKFLDVDIETDQESYKPGEKAEWTLRLTDHEGNPVQGELALAVVDEAIYQIEEDRTSDPRKALHGDPRRYVGTETSIEFRPEGIGQATGNLFRERNQQETDQNSVSQRSFASGGSSGRFIGGALFSESKAKDHLAPARLRSEFADSAVWRPHLRTDEEGTVTVSFPMPDDLTTWRAKVIAIDRTSRAGQAVQKVVSRQNLMVQMEHPRTFTETDEATVSAVVHNYLSETKTCHVRLKHDGGTLIGGKQKRTIRIKPNTNRRVDWRLKIDTSDPVTLQTAALTESESDAMKRTVDVIPYGVKTVQGDGGLLSGNADTSNAKMTFTLPKGDVRASTKLSVSASPSLGGSMFESLEYLIDYPHGCVEQTMSRFLPNISVLESMRRLGITQPELAKKIDEYTSEGLQRLYNFQQNNGGWGWWKQDESNPYMTAYVLYGFAKARAADYTVSQKSIDRGVQFLEEEIQNEENLDNRAYMLFAYSQYKQPREAWMDHLLNKRKSLNDFGVALLLLTLEKMDRGQDVQRVKSLLTDRASDAGGTAWWGEENNYHHWSSNRLQSTAFALKALVHADPDHRLIGKAVQYLVTKRRGRYWRSTKDTAAILLALSDYMEQSGELQADYTATVFVNGTRIDRFRVTPDMMRISDRDPDEDERKKTPLPDGLNAREYDIPAKHLTPGKNVVEIRRNGEKGNLYFSAAMTHFDRGKTLTEGRASGIEVKRHYARLVPQETEKGIRYKRVPLKGSVKSGDEIEVRLTVKANDAEYLMIEDPLPSGCEVIRNKSDLNKKYRHWSNYSSRREARDEKMVFFNSHLNGKNTYVYTLRAETPGEFNVMPARAELMYQPEINGHSPITQMSILEK